MTAQHYIRRPRLLDLLDDVVHTPVTLVVAPAGAGKTSLLSGWMNETSIHAAWLSLDESDRDGAQFWTGVIAAVQELAPGSGGDALALLRRSAPAIDVVEQLLVELEAADSAPAVVIIDDFQAVDDDESVTTPLALFLRHLPPWFHVILASRRDPSLPLDRMRSQGVLGEIRFAELRFSPDEATELLTRLAPSLSDAGIKAACQHADGWAASLQLAALATRSARAQLIGEPPPSGADLLIHDYVLREVLAQEDPEIIEVLFAVAVVQRVNPSLAQRLSGRSDADELMVRAVERGLFATRLGPEGWIELHSLFRAVLQAEQARRSPSHLAELHARAAAWFEDADEAVFALEQWLLADRPRDALRLLAVEHAALYDSGREVTILRTLAAIPASVATADLESMVEYAWCHMLVNRRRFLELVEQLMWWVERSAADEALRERVVLLRSIAATMTGRWVEGGELARQAVLRLGDGWWRDPIGGFGWNMVARTVALSELWDDASDEVSEARIGLSRDPGRQLSFEGTRALGEALAGRPVDALRVAAGVRRLAAVAEMAILRTELAVAEALAHRELGDRSRAVSELTALSEAPAETMLYCRILALLELAQAHLDHGDLDAARQTFRQAESLVDSESFGQDGRSWLARVGTLIALADDDMGEAHRWATQLDDPFWGPVSRGRVHLAGSDRTAAVAALDTAVPRCVRHEVVLGLLRARVTTDRDVAMKLAATAVERAADNGLLQTVASEGLESIELVELAAWRAPVEWLDRVRRAAAESQRRVRPGRTGLIEPLTERELDVLRFLPSRLTVNEIGRELYVSVNTLKFHLRVIYRKLGVHSRAEAVEVARSMALL